MNPFKWLLFTWQKCRNIVRIITVPWPRALIYDLSPINTKRNTQIYVARYVKYYRLLIGVKSNTQRHLLDPKKSGIKHVHNQSVKYWRPITAYTVMFGLNIWGVIYAMDFSNGFVIFADFYTKICLQVCRPVPVTGPRVPALPLTGDICTAVLHTAHHYWSLLRQNRQEALVLP